MMTHAPKWTPGPWRLDRSGMSGSIFVRAGYRDINDSTIVIVSTKKTTIEDDDLLGRHNRDFRRTIYTETPIKSAEANAHLIAAAPDLYAALREVLDGLGALSNPHELETLIGSDEAARVVAALAKAEGRTER